MDVLFDIEILTCFENITICLKWNRKMFWHSFVTHRYNLSQKLFHPIDSDNSKRNNYAKEETLLMYMVQLYQVSLTSRWAEWCCCGPPRPQPPPYPWPTPWGWPSFLCPPSWPSSPSSSASSASSPRSAPPHLRSHRWCLWRDPINPNIKFKSD